MPRAKRPAGVFRLATFNVENLFIRYRFEKGRAPSKDGGFTIDKLAFEVFNEEEKVITAKAIRETDADLLCLQEVESLACLDRFNSQYLGGMGYRHRLLIDSHDPRHIDVAVLSRTPILHARTRRDERTRNAFLFSRDCLEVEVEVAGAEGKRMAAYVNHFKSMKEGREATRPRRAMQVARVAEIVVERMKGPGKGGNFAVVGDFNDYVDADTSLGPLLHHPRLRNVVDRLPEEERWTHWWDKEDSYRQLDYVLLPEHLDKAAGRPAPGIVRKGLPQRARRHAGARFPGVGKRRPSASDHCPVYVDLPLAALK